MKKLLLLLFCLLPIMAIATIGGNISSLRPAYTAADATKTTLSASYLSKGAWARFSAIWWEIFWLADPAKGNYAGIDKVLEICVAGNLTPVILISPTPYPSSPWGSGSDWWLPARPTWDKIRECNVALIKHVQSKLGSGYPVYWQLMNEPAGKMLNPPLGEKPGGSNSTKFGQWTPDLHELLFRTATDLVDNNVTPDHIISPALSCVGENNKREAVEWLTFQPPAKFDWLKLCGNVAVHLRFSAAWAVDPATRLQQVTDGFENCTDYAQFCIDQVPVLQGKKIVLTEAYVTPADCGLAIGADLNPYRLIAVGLVEKHNWQMIVWGLLPDEADAPGQPFLFYGGWGNWLRSLPSVSSIGN
jgi:hypothetical protein